MEFQISKLRLLMWEIFKKQLTKVKVSRKYEKLRESQKFHMKYRLSVFYMEQIRKIY